MMNVQHTLLAVLAHPDDESFGLGGTLALYAKRGVKVYLVCATRGEVGEMDPKYMLGFTSVAERRQDELRCAAAKLGLTGVYFLNYRDSGMPGSPDNSHPDALAFQRQEKVAGDVAYYIRLLKPQVVVTFDPIGGYHHPDHIAIHKATVQAFYDAARPERAIQDLPPHQAAKLYFQTIPRGFLRLVVKILPLFGKNPRKYGTNGDIDLVEISKVHFPVHAEIDFAEVSQAREQASACHESQGGASLTGGGLMGRLRKSMMAKEQYMRAFPEVPQNMPREKDLFEGIP